MNKLMGQSVVRRSFWTTVGFLCGIFTAIVSWFVVYFWLLSLVHAVEKLIGFSLPNGAEVIWKRDERDGTFGQGAALTIFVVPKQFALQIRAKCPAGFNSGTFDQSGISAVDVDVDSRSPACLFVKEDRNREDKVVLVNEKLVHLRIDR